MWATPQPKASRPMADSAEAKPLLKTYDATTSRESVKKHASLTPTGRGKLRFGMRRQQMKKIGRSRSTGGIYNSIFTSQRHHQKVTQNSSSKKVGSPREEKSFNKKPEPLSVDQDEPPIPATKHSHLYNALNPKSRCQSARLYQQFITTVILFDALVYILSTEPSLQIYHRLFYSTEAVTSTIFAIEYFSRLLVCTEKHSYAKYGPIRGRWKYMCSSMAILDALATFPFFVELVSGIPLPTLTYLRVFRVLRITRTRSYSQAMVSVCVL